MLTPASVGSDPRPQSARLSPAMAPPPGMPPSPGPSSSRPLACTRSSYQPAPEVTRASKTPQPQLATVARAERTKTMDIMELTGRTLRISKQSLTCINDETGKTEGVVRGCIQYTAAPIRDQQPLFRAVKASGLWGSGRMDQVIISRGRLHYLDNQRPTYNDELDRKRRALVQGAQAAGIVVIPCTIKK